MLAHSAEVFHFYKWHVDNLLRSIMGEMPTWFEQVTDLHVSIKKAVITANQLLGIQPFEED